MPIYSVLPTRRLSVSTNLRLSIQTVPLTGVPISPVAPVAPALPFPDPMAVLVTSCSTSRISYTTCSPLGNPINAIPPYTLGYVDSSLNVAPPPLYDPKFGAYGFGRVSPGLSYTYSPYFKLKDGALITYSSVGGYGNVGNCLTSPLCIPLDILL